MSIETINLNESRSEDEFITTPCLICDRGISLYHNWDLKTRLICKECKNKLNELLYGEREE